MKKLLVVIDYQNDFVSGSLGFEQAKEIEDYLVELITSIMIIMMMLFLLTIHIMMII